MSDWSDQLYRLLPAIHQIRDGEQGEPLRQFLSVIGGQVQSLQVDIEQLYDNWFVETCDDWVVPYLGDLVGFRRVADGGEPSDAVTARNRSLNKFLFPRREIANLVRRRRRKGTLSVLEDIARDATSWHARAADFSRNVAYFQNVSHPDPKTGGTVNMRCPTTLARMNTPFDTTARTVDVRQVQPRAGIGWYHPRKVGLFVWRRRVYPMTRVAPCRVCTSNNQTHVSAYAFNRLGIRQPLYVLPQKETDELQLASEVNLPVPLTRRLLADVDGTVRSEFYGAGSTRQKSLAIYLRASASDDWKLLSKRRVHVQDLSEPSSWEACSKALGALKGEHVAVDPECGVLLFAHCKPSIGTEIQVTYHYAAAMDLGGGEYERPALSAVRLPAIRFSSIDLGERKGASLFDVAAARSPLGGSESDCTADSKTASEFISLEKCDPGEGERWIVRKSVIFVLNSSQEYKIDSDQILEIADHTTLELRSAPGSWPLVKIGGNCVVGCPGSWRVLLGKGSRLVIDGLHLCGATIQLEDRSSIPRDDCGTMVRGSADCSCQRVGDSVLHVAGCASGSALLSAEVIVRHTTFLPGCHGFCEKPQSRPTHPSFALYLSAARFCVNYSILAGLTVERPECGQPNTKSSEKACPPEPIVLHIADSIVDGGDSCVAILDECGEQCRAELDLERSTLLGDVKAKQITRADNTLFAGIVNVQQCGTGFMRFCYVPRGPCEIPIMPGWVKGPDFVRTPQRFKCLPDGHDPLRESKCGEYSAGAVNPLSHAVRRRPVVPEFISTLYGSPGYCELKIDSALEVRHGAEDESEIGVFHDLFNPQREAALKARLEEYTPAEIESGVIYADDLELFRTIGPGNSSHPGK